MYNKNEIGIYLWIKSLLGSFIFYFMCLYFESWYVYTTIIFFAIFIMPMMYIKINYTMNGIVFKKS